MGDWVINPRGHNELNGIIKAMQSQTACCVLLNTYRTGGEQFTLDPCHVAISTNNGYIEGCLHPNSEDEFQYSSFISADFMWKKRYFAKAHMREF